MTGHANVAPGVSRQRFDELLGRLRLVLRVAPHQRQVDLQFLFALPANAL
jgi:hypothetical protein